ncbi:MAG: 4-hydroxy-3-methylbut-2-enyl diphosphate reductase [Acidobacteria bacterium]|nr:4-hydroxy-3-methylbut-2-enyl diphosphate reductase [Acidobacteriota bacterium]
MLEAMKRVLLAKPRGFCAGVVRAIDIVNVALELYGKPIYVRKEIVHNLHVVEELRREGVVFVEELDEVPESARVVFSAHGISPEVRRQAADRQLRVIDATCPLVTKVHLEAIKYAREGYSIILIGHKGHDEVTGTLGEAPQHMTLLSTVEEVDQLEVPDPKRVAYLTQTTLSLDDTREVIRHLRRKFPAVVGPPADDICYATQNRQIAIKAIARDSDVVLVIGAANSSNSNRLVEVAQSAGTRAYLIDDERGIDPAWLEEARTVGVTAGASAPEILVERVLDKLKEQGFTEVREVEVMEEDVRFALPSELVRDMAALS